MPNTREKLIELTTSERLADYLIANGVTIPVRCKDCEWGVPYSAEHDGWTECTNIPGRPAFRDDGFCSYGERKQPT